MNLQEAVEHLEKAGFEARIMGEDILAEKRDEQGDIRVLFGIYKEEKKWLATFWMGQLIMAIRWSEQIETIIGAITSFFRLRSQRTEQSISIERAIWTLQKNGLAAELITDTDIRVFPTEVKEVTSVYKFIVGLSVAVFEDRQDALILRWSREQNQWGIYEEASASLRQSVPTLYEAVEYVLGLWCSDPIRPD